MARHKDTNWNLTDKGTPADGGGTAYKDNTILFSLLMDLRDELAEIRRVLHNNITWDSHGSRELRGLRRDVKARMKPRCHRAHQ